MLAGLVDSGENAEILLTGSSSTGNLVEGNLVGTDITGTVGIGSYRDINIGSGATGNTIGGTITAAANVLASSGYGVLIDASSPGNLVEGNKIGTDITGTVALANTTGVLIASANNTIGGTSSGAGNLISGNASDGVDLSASQNIVLGNYIGTDVAGTVAIANGEDGVNIYGGATGNTIGGTEPGAANVISGNVSNGISLSGAGTSSNVIAGNLIGTDATGTAAISNGNGIGLTGGTQNTIGGTTAGSGNVISGNTGVGIGDSDSYDFIAGNVIGVTANGSTALPNGADGLDLNAPYTTVGGLTALARNVISGNSGGGITITQAYDLVEGNLIGTDPTGTIAIGNAVDGIWIVGYANAETIGGTTLGSANVISANGNGIEINSGSSVVQGNLIGTDAAGTVSLGNRSGDGIGISNSDNTIGGTTLAAANIIDGADKGIDLSGSDNVIEGNRVGTNAAGTAQIGNNWGIMLHGGPNTIGGSAAGAGNLVSGNFFYGVADFGTGDVIGGNFIGTDVTGTVAIGDGNAGVLLQGGPATVGGLTATPGTGLGNVISGSTNGNGVWLESSGCVIIGNLIGTDLTGENPVGNGGGIYVRGTSNTIGGTADGSMNVISGNDVGISMYITGTSFNVVVGNYIGTDITGTQSVPNNDGVMLADGVSFNTIGGAAAGDQNVISGNADDGVLITDSGTDSNAVQGNLIGTDYTGENFLGNGAGVVIVSGASGNTIGGPTVTPGSGLGNLIDGSFSLYGNGVSIQGSTANVVQGNIIGLNAGGSQPLYNSDGGITIDGAASNTIGGLAAGAGNVISGNGGPGISVMDAGANDNLIQGNLIGTNADDNSGVLNEGDGIELSGAATGTTIGGTTAGAGNVISGNSGVGIDDNAPDTLIAGNMVGVDATGEIDIFNFNSGIVVTGNNVTIGGTTAAARNIISANLNVGLQVNSSGNLIEGNYIGTDETGTVALSNFGAGIYFDGGGSSTIGGTSAGAGNLVSGNNRGIWLSGANNILVQGNKVGTDLAGTVALPNIDLGIYILNSSSNTIGGSSAVPATWSRAIRVTASTSLTRRRTT